MARSRKPGPGQDSLFPAPQPTAAKKPRKAAKKATPAAQGEQLSTEPILQAHQFIAAHKANGGATMSVTSGHVYSPGEPGFMVGGAPDAKGHQIPSVIRPSGAWGADEVMAQRERVASTAATPETATIGSWNHQGQTHFDASTVFHDRREASNAGYHRNQIAIWDNAKGEEIETGGTGQGPKRYPSNPDLHAGSWRGYDIEARGAQVNASADADRKARVAASNTRVDPKPNALRRFNDMSDAIAKGRA